MKKKKQSIPEQVIKALDGRTQRWLSFEIRVPEQQLSRKMNSIIPFTPEELKRIEERLSFKFDT
jgi:hypothetical protein